MAATIAEFGLRSKAVHFTLFTIIASHPALYAESDFSRCPRQWMWRMQRLLHSIEGSLYRGSSQAHDVEQIGLAAKRAASLTTKPDAADPIKQLEKRLCARQNAEVRP